MLRVRGSRLALVLIALVVFSCNGDPEVVPGQETPGVNIRGSNAVLVVGDWGAGTAEQEAVAGAMSRVAESHDVGAIVTTGDNFYSNDAGTLMAPFSWATEGDIPFLVAWGNHDIESAERLNAINEVFDAPPRWVAHRWGEVDVVILDSTQVESERQVEFLTGTLAGSDRPTIVVFHHPPFSCGSHGETERIQESWVPEFDEDVFLVLSGHEHNYQRFDVSGVTYVVTGGGGASLTGLSACPSGHPERTHGESLHHFLVLEQDGSFSVSATAASGDVIDAFTLELP